MRSQRAEEIARKLNETERWHSHGYGINELQLKIEDYSQAGELKDAITGYHSLFEDFSHKLGLDGVMHTAENFIPVSRS